MYQISTLNKISPVGMNCLSNEYIVTDNIQDADGILVRSQDMHEMMFSEKLKSIARAGAGVNNIPLDRCANEGIVVFNTPGANANAVKELVVSGLLLAARNIPSALSWAKDLKEDVSKTVEKGKSQFAGSEITGKTLGVIGLGAIGRKVANVASALGMEILGYDPFYTSGGEGITVYSDLAEMVSLCDYVTLHLPANDATKGMINKDLLSSFKDGAVLLNFSRDKLVNDIDLLVSLEQGKLSQYVTDFPNDNLVDKDKVILLPHLGASTAEAEDNCAIMAVNETRDYLENGNIINSVNFKKVDLGKLEDGIRLSFIVKDMQDPEKEIIEIVKNAGLNVTKHAFTLREDNIGYVLIEISNSDVDTLLFSGEIGAKIIKFRQINK